MRVQLLYYPDCPSHERALELVYEALQAEGVRADVEVVRIETDEEAERYRFVGSPTIRFNSIEVDPQPQLPYRLTCRTFLREDGRLSPVPSLTMLRETIRKAMEEEEEHGIGTG
ncbi:MAG: thioredoxin family protein [Armatimonadota bacterium]|nr:thioredoxin family protein [bacterium]MDW8319810.1 thioredoxin family protein [Armatimonadota bacterium]